MHDRTIVISGTSRGIGFHLAKRFLAEGFRVIGISRSVTPIDDPKFRQISADLSNLDRFQAIGEALSGERISGLINNAGIHGPVGAFDDLPLDEWVNTFNINLFGGALLSKICLPSLRKENGFIIFMSGGGGAFPRPNYSAYGASKSGVIRFADTLASELTPDVLVYCIAPGPNRTRLLDETRSNGELVQEQDIVDFDSPGNLCVFLANNQDARYSGKFIHVMDNYASWDDRHLTNVAYTMRRVDPRTLARLDLGIL